MIITRRKAVLLGASFFALLLGGAALFTTYKLSQKEKPTLEKEVPSRKLSEAELIATSADAIPTDKLIAQVGKEKIYGSDFKFYLSVYHPNTITKRESITKPIQEDALERIAKDSRILQGAEAKGLLELERSFFEGSNKDNERRLEKAQSVIGEIQRNLVNVVSGEKLSIWFNTQTTKSTLGVERAKSIAREKIETIYQGLKTGKHSSFEEAAEVIRGDSALAELDPSYKTNAYSSFKNVSPGEDFLEDPKLAESFLSLKEGEISDILTFHTEEGEEHSFVIFHIIKKEITGFESFADWLKEQERCFPLEVYF